MSATEESIQVWIVSMIGQNAEDWRSVLSAGEWEKAMRFRMPADQKRSAVTRGVLRTLLGGYLGCAAVEIQFTETGHGKYSIPDARIEFNVSHSGDYALLAFARESPVGVDVERIASDRVVSELARRVLTPSEHERFMALPEGDRRRAFFEIWTLKESLLKGIGSGLSIPPECLEIAFYPNAPELLTASTDQITDVREWTLASLSIGHEDYAAAIAVKHRSPKIEIKRFDTMNTREHEF